MANTVFYTLRQLAERLLPDGLVQLPADDDGPLDHVWAEAPNIRDEPFQIQSTFLFEVELALGIPVVVARLETLAAHFGPEEVTFFEPGDATSLADALRWVAVNPDAAREKTKAAGRRAREYSWQENRGRYVELLTSTDSRRT